MGNYTTKMKREALRLLEQGRSLAEVRGYIDTRYASPDANQYAGRELDLDDYLNGAIRAEDALEVNAMRGLNG